MRKQTQQLASRRRPDLDEKYFVPTATLKAAMAEAPKIDYRRFRADLDAYLDQDPLPRIWRQR